VDPVPDPLLLRKSGSAGDRTRDLCICSQKLWPLDHRGGHCLNNIYQICLRVYLNQVPDIMCVWKPWCHSKHTSPTICSCEYTDQPLFFYNIIQTDHLRWVFSRLCKHCKNTLPYVQKNCVSRHLPTYTSNIDNRNTPLHTPTWWLHRTLPYTP